MSVPNLFTIRQFCGKHGAFTTGGLRHLIFHEHSNGLHRSRSIIRLGRKVLIDEERFFKWVSDQNGVM